MSETSSDSDAYGIDPTEFGPEAVDGTRTAGIGDDAPPEDDEPGDPDLHGDDEAEPTS